MSGTPKKRVGHNWTSGKANPGDLPQAGSQTGDTMVVMTISKEKLCD
tara:strand:+ start:228 stop:368 length:141 start_codon:yes stop_codon:yes gene_type:complete